MAIGVTQPGGGDCDKDETVDVGGHASNERLDECKQTLSERRAVAVKNYLAENAIGAVRVTVVGYGKQQPLMPNDSETNRSQNRRATVTPVYPEQGDRVGHAVRASLTAFCTTRTKRAHWPRSALPFRDPQPPDEPTVSLILAPASWAAGGFLVAPSWHTPC